MASNEKLKQIHHKTVTRSVLVSDLPRRYRQNLRTWRDDDSVRCGCSTVGRWQEKESFLVWTFENKYAFSLPSATVAAIFTVPAHLRGLLKRGSQSRQYFETYGTLRTARCKLGQTCSNVTANLELDGINISRAYEEELRRTNSTKRKGDRHLIIYFEKLGFRHLEPFGLGVMLRKQPSKLYTRRRRPQQCKSVAVRVWFGADTSMALLCTYLDTSRHIWI